METGKQLSAYCDLAVYAISPKVVLAAPAVNRGLVHRGTAAYLARRSNAERGLTQGQRHLPIARLKRVA
jgi:hypothetical protein